MMKKIVIWGGNNKPISLDNMDSHASVNAYFLGKQLARKCNKLVNIVEMDSPELLLEHLDADLILSTFQYGFTSRIINKDKKDIFIKLRRGYKGKLCSIIDDNYCRKYYEDILFTVLPENSNVKLKYFRKVCFALYNQKTKPVTMGWSADPDECYPETVADNEFNILIDHGPYGCNEDDLTSSYLTALKEVKNTVKNKKLHVYIQDNNGISQIDLKHTHELLPYVRTNKVPWPQVISIYRKCQVFCVTHRESAGLAVIEAAMSGAKIYVPKKENGKSFISEALLGQGINYFIFDSKKSMARNLDVLKAEFLNDIYNVSGRQEVHDTLAKTNSWYNAAQNIIAAVDN